MAVPKPISEAVRILQAAKGHEFSIGTVRILKALLAAAKNRDVPMAWEHCMHLRETADFVQWAAVNGVTLPNPGARPEMTKVDVAFVKGTGQ